MGRWWPCRAPRTAAAGAPAEGLWGRSAGCGRVCPAALGPPRGPLGPPQATEHGSVLFSLPELTHPRRTPSAAGLRLRVHLRGGVRLPPRLPQAHALPRLSGHADPPGGQLRPGPASGPWPPGHRRGGGRARPLCLHCADGRDRRDRQVGGAACGVLPRAGARSDSGLSSLLVGQTDSGWMRR